MSGSSKDEASGSGRDAVGAALRVAASFDVISDDPVVLQETNNTVVWLRPYPVVAKVGKWKHSQASLVREHRIAAALSADGAPVGPPVAGTAPVRDDETGYTVTLWERLEHDSDQEPDPVAAASSLRDLHGALDGFGEGLPNLEESLDLAQATLWDDGAMKVLSASDRLLLRSAYERLRNELTQLRYPVRPVHGEAHLGNLLVTPDGLRWIDLENVSMGPLEWDLAFLPEGSAEVFPEADDRLLALLRTLNSARVATWCFARWEFEELHWHGRHHLEVVRRAKRAARGGGG
jgi:aminoglycoside phosphotransferase (APT) family kinase protein